MSHNNPDEFLGIDVGAVNIGLARGSSAAKVAEPLNTLSAAGAIEGIIQIASQNKTTAIVIGLPRNLDGEDTDQTRYVRDWALKAKNQIKLPFYWQDEALTSEAAAKMKLVPKGLDEHALAAAVFLQDFLDTPDEDKARN